VSESANVTSVAALQDFRAALVGFAAEARQALDATDAEIRRVQDWLEDQLKTWQATVRRCEDEVFRARTELTRRKMVRIGDRQPDCTEQEEALREAQDKLEYAEDKVKVTRRWIQQLPHAVIDYEGPARQLGGFLEAELTRACALLDYKSDVLDAYLRETAPAAPAPPAAAGTPAPAPEEKPKP
jgi:chromosome segregation ATPase